MLCWQIAIQGFSLDGTFGRGGHTRLLLSKLDENARVYGFDKDPQALAVAAELEQEDPRFKIIHASFADLKHELRSTWYWLGRWCYGRFGRVFTAA